MPVDLNEIGDFGRYQLIRRISLGGMAEVFKAKSFNDFGFEKVVALKRLLPSIAQKSGFVEMLIQEAKIAARLDHKSICRIYELGKVDDAYYLTMEFIYGHDLRQAFKALKESGRAIDPHLAAWLGMRVADALNTAYHTTDDQDRPLNLVHRDVSPQNIMIGFDGQVKVIDFGIAKVANATIQTAAGVLKGKYAYMSPEHAGRQPLDARSDIWSLGVVLHELLSGRRLFIGASMADTVDQVLHADVPPLSEAPEALAAIVERMVQRDLDTRYADHAEVLADLQRYVATSDALITTHTIAAWMDELFPSELRVEADLTDEEFRFLFSAEERDEETTDMRSDVSSATQIFLMDETGQADYREVLQALLDRGRVHTVMTQPAANADPESSGSDADAAGSDASQVLWDALWAAVAFVGVTLLLMSV